MNELNTTTTNTATTTTISELYARYISFAQVSPTSQRTYSECLKKFFNYLASIECTRPTRETILAYKAHLLATISPASTALNLVAVRGFFKWLEVEGLYKDITKGIKTPKISRLHKKGYLASEQVQALINSLNLNTELGARDCAIVLLMATCGLRCIEISEACKEDIRPTNGGLILMVRGKGQVEKNNPVNIPDITAKALNHYLAIASHKSNALFASTSNNSKGQAIPPKTLSNIIKARFVEAGLDTAFITAHSLRHTAITLAILAGERLDKVQAFARHSNIQTTMIYNHALELEKNTCANSVAQLLNVALA